MRNVSKTGLKSAFETKADLGDDVGRDQGSRKRRSLGYGSVHGKGPSIDACPVKLQIILETEREKSTLDSFDGFTHIGVWLHSIKIHTSVTLMVGAGKVEL